MEALEKAGCKKIFEDKISGSRAERPGLANVLEILREGDSVARNVVDQIGHRFQTL